MYDFGFRYECIYSTGNHAFHGDKSLCIFYRLSQRSVYERWPKKKQDLSKTRTILRIEYQILVRRNYSDFYQIYYNYIISKRDALLA